MKERIVRSSQILSESPQLLGMARQLRKEPTVAERELWRALRGKQLETLRFRRQHVLHGHIVDFFCHAKRLCIEVDGGYHSQSEQKDLDQRRDSDLKNEGYQTLRISNEEVMANRDQVARKILAFIRTTEAPPPL